MPDGGGASGPAFAANHSFFVSTFELRPLSS
jgi:hypothetical protein